MIRVGIIIGSTRPGRNTEKVARWVFEKLQNRNEAEFELVDLADFDLPLLDEPMPPMYHQYSKEHTKVWSQKVTSLDAFIFVTPEYNHSTSAALKNAMDYLYQEWNNKAAAFVSFGSALGARAVENLRLVCSELQIAHVRNQVSFSLRTDFENYSVFKPSAHHEKALNDMVEQLITWGVAMKNVREPAQSMENLKNTPNDPNVARELM